jgi:hypothetical protein
MADQVVATSGVILEMLLNDPKVTGPVLSACLMSGLPPMGL